MPHPTLLVRGTAAMAALVLLAGCQPQEPREAPDDPPFRPDPVEVVSIEVDCQADPIRFVVRPWAAWVQEGRPLRWTHRGPGLISTRIEVKDPERWPFDQRPPDRADQPGTPIETGTRQPAEQGVYRYSIILDCGDRGRFDIDPDIIVNGPW
jgi:hypothetical protein